jgi:aryl-alcohol dehydrogenase-like predicted oxidoreductase
VIKNWSVRRWLFRGKVVIATKFGFAYDENGEQVGLSIAARSGDQSGPRCSRSFRA